MSNWIIKTRENFREFVIRGDVGRWYSTRLPKSWKMGDTLFIWAAGQHLRIVGRGKLVNPDDGSSRGFRHFTVKYLTNPIEGPSIEELRRDPIVGPASFLKQGPSGTIFQLTDQQSSRLSQLIEREKQPLVGKRKDLVTSAVEETLGKHSAGFGDAKTNRRVERAAIRAATRHYSNQEFIVTSVERFNCGYDLKCRRGREELHIEVKGSAGLGRGFLITAGEYSTALRDARFQLCLVRNALKRPTVTTMCAGEMLEHYRFEPLAHRAIWVKDESR